MSEDRIAELNRVIRLYKGLNEAIDETRGILADGVAMLLRRIEAVHAIHQDRGDGHCKECTKDEDDLIVPYPCRTVRALFAEEEVSDDAGQDPVEHPSEGSDARPGPG